MRILKLPVHVVTWIFFQFCPFRVVAFAGFQLGALVLVERTVRFGEVRTAVENQPRQTTLCCLLSRALGLGLGLGGLECQNAKQNFY